MLCYLASVGGEKKNLIAGESANNHKNEHKHHTITSTIQRYSRLPQPLRRILERK